jgi:hypothetical protein
MWLGLLPLGLFYGLFVFNRRRRRKTYGGPPKFSGPPLAGTAQIRYVPRGKTPIDSDWNRQYPPIRGIPLTVTIPGHEPYDATATQEVPVPVLKRIESQQRGTVAVQVDSTDLNYVRIDFNQPIT